MKGESRTPAFLARNPNGRIPLLELPDGRHLAESNAILNFIASGTAATCRTIRGCARWCCNGSSSSSTATSRTSPPRVTSRCISDCPKSRRAEYEGKQKGGHAALRVMESQLAHLDYLVGDRFTIADISLYGYTHVAGEGGFSLDAYPGINRWLARIAAHPRHLTMADG